MLRNWMSRTEEIEREIAYLICMEWLDLQKIWISKTVKIQREIVCIIYVRNLWICRKIEYPELRKFKGKLCTLYMYRMFGLAKKLNVQSCKNSTGNCTLYVRKVWICRKLKIQNFENSMENCVHYICTERWDL